MKVIELQSKIGILEAENKLLKESCSNKQKLLEVVLEYNFVLIKGKSKHVINPIDKQVNLNKSTCDSQNHMGSNESIYSWFNALRETCYAEKAENPGDPYRYEWHSTRNQYNEDG